MACRPMSTSRPQGLNGKRAVRRAGQGENLGHNLRRKMTIAESPSAPNEGAFWFRISPSPTMALSKTSVAERPVALPPVTRKERANGLPFFTCPTTHLRAPTGIETDVQSLHAAWKAMVIVKCPHCGEFTRCQCGRHSLMACWRMLSAGSLSPG
jgi:hypothetical protein